MTPSPSKSDGALDELEVVELTSAIAGPFTTKLLADCGANVTKVEPLKGAAYRNRPLDYDTADSENFVYRFMPYNMGKFSVAVDLKNDEGAAIFWDLIEEADIIVENMRAGVMERLGFGWEELHRRNPELIYCSITGYGEDGPYRDWPAIDTTVQAVAGWADQNGTGDRPETMDVFAIDHTTALYAAVGVLTAIIERSTSGVGQRVDVAMFDVATSLLGHQFAEYSAAQNDPDIEATYEGHFAPNGTFEISDGYLGMFVPPESWAPFCEAIGHRELIDDERFNTVGQRVDNREQLRDVLEATLTKQTAREWIDRFAEKAPGVVSAPVNRMAEIPTDEHIQARDMTETHEHPELGSYTVPRPALHFSQNTVEVGAVPELGEQTNDMLAALGYEADTIERLHEDGIIR